GGRQGRVDVGAPEGHVVGGEIADDVVAAGGAVAVDQSGLDRVFTGRRGARTRQDVVVAEDAHHAVARHQRSERATAAVQAADVVRAPAGRAHLDGWGLLAS